MRWPPRRNDVRLPRSPLTRLRSNILKAHGGEYFTGSFTFADVMTA